MLKKSAKDAFGYIRLNSNDPQHIDLIFLASGVSYNGHGCSITPSTFERCLIIGGIRSMIKKTWLNETDQYQIPESELPREFVTDCIVWFLFEGNNQSAAFDGEYEGVEFRMPNEFYPYSSCSARKWMQESVEIEEESFVYNWIQRQELSQEAQELLTAGRDVYKMFYQELDNLDKEKFKLGLWNPGW